MSAKQSAEDPIRNRDQKEPSPQVRYRVTFLSLIGFPPRSRYARSDAAELSARSGRIRTTRSQRVGRRRSKAPTCRTVCQLQREDEHTGKWCFVAVSYSVPGMTCGHCASAITGEVTRIAGVEDVDVDLDAKTVTVYGERLDDAALRAAIDEAGYEIA